MVLVGTGTKKPGQIQKSARTVDIAHCTVAVPTTLTLTVVCPITAGIRYVIYCETAHLAVTSVHHVVALFSSVPNTCTVPLDGEKCSTSACPLLRLGTVDCGVVGRWQGRRYGMARACAKERRGRSLCPSLALCARVRVRMRVCVRVCVRVSVCVCGSSAAAR
eukprot:COSAG02_NODE_8591_length_2511_cov_9.911277_4_plen_163_part_00